MFGIGGEKGYGLYVICGPEVRIPISNRLALPTYVEDLDIMLSNIIFQQGGKFIPGLSVELVHPVILLPAF